MNAAQVVESLSKAIASVEAFRKAKKQYPKEAAAAEQMFISCYPARERLIGSISNTEDGAANACPV